MPQSMTGYGRGEAATNHVTVVVELKSVNNRFRDLQLRVPREYGALEPRMLSLLKAAIARGRVDVFIRRQGVGSERRLTTDRSLARAYVEAAQQLAQELPGVDGSVSLAFVLSQPGVLVVEEAETDVMGEWPIVEAALTAAIDDLLTMRQTEGAALVTTLKTYVTEARDLAAHVEAAVVSVAETIQQRLQQRLDRLIAERLDPARLAQEVAILADKADISEELTRLGSHLDQLSDALESDEPVGRRLDFLLQELNREANTMGAKTADHAVSAHVVELKALLERMREQSANLQ
ncbi:MAG: YicC/YloC family endoribonuclease [Myxococcota bacterium]